MERRLELSSGVEVELRPVPSYVLFQVARKLPALPDAPTRTVETAAGEQEVEIDIEAPEYQEWMEEYEQAQEARMLANWSLTLNYGIKKWRKKPKNALHRFLAVLGVGYQWESEPPESWAVPKELGELIESTGNRRLDYIYFSLLADPVDFGRVLRTLQSTTTDLTEEEVREAEKSFRNGVEGNGASQGEREWGAGEDDVLRDGSSEGVGADA